MASWVSSIHKSAAARRKQQEELQIMQNAQQSRKKLSKVLKLKFKNFMTDKMYSHSAKQYDQLNPTVIDKQFKSIDEGLNARLPAKKSSPRPPAAGEATKESGEHMEEEKPPTPRRSE